MRKRVDDDGLFDLWLGFIFSLGAGLCVVGIGADSNKIWADAVVSFYIINR